MMYRLGPDIAPYNCLFQNAISYCGYLHVWQHDGNDIKKKRPSLPPLNHKDVYMLQVLVTLCNHTPCPAYTPFSL